MSSKNPEPLKWEAYRLKQPMGKYTSFFKGMILYQIASNTNLTKAVESQGKLAYFLSQKRKHVEH